MYSVETLGIGDGLTFSMYMFCGMSVVFLMLTTLVYAPLYIKSDYSLNRIMYIKNRSSVMQVLCEFTAFFVSMILVCVAVFTALSVFDKFTGVFENMGMTQNFNVISFAFKMIPVVFMVSALSFLIFEINKSLISGVLLQFFISVALCYASGCIYPVYTFPDTIQILSKYLPTGVARGYLAECVSNGTDTVKILFLLLFSVLFVGVSILVRRRKIAAKQVLK